MSVKLRENQMKKFYPGSCQCPLLPITMEWWPDQLPRWITKATSVLEYFIKGEIIEHQSKTLIRFHSFNLCKNNRYLQKMITSKTPSEHKLAFISFAVYSSPFQTTCCRSKHDLHSSVKTTSSRVKVQVQVPPSPQKSGTSFLWLYEKVDKNNWW